MTTREHQPETAKRRAQAPAASGSKAAPGHALEQVFLDHFDAGPDDGAIATSRAIHVFQCGMVSEAALKDLLCESERRRDAR